MPRWSSLALGSLVLCGQLAGPGAASAAGVLGTLDPSTGTFRPLGIPALAPAGTLSATGTLVISLKVTVASSLPGTSIITCSASASLPLSGGLAGIITEDASTVATRTGSTASCQMKIPYLWTGFTSTDMVNVGYSVIVTTTGGGDARDSLHPIAAIKVPASGKTTSFTVNATI